MDNLKVLKLPYTENYIQNRVDRFYEEFLSDEQSHQHIEQVLATIHDYLLLCDEGESVELTQSIINQYLKNNDLDKHVQTMIEDHSNQCYALLASLTYYLPMTVGRTRPEGVCIRRPQSPDTVAWSV